MKIKIFTNYSIIGAEYYIQTITHNEIDKDLIVLAKIKEDKINNMSFIQKMVIYHLEFYNHNKVKKLIHLINNYD